MDNYNIREKNFVENYLNKKILWRNQRMYDIKSVKKFTENEFKANFNKNSPQKTSKKNSIQYDNSQDGVFIYNSPQRSQIHSRAFNNLSTDISDKQNSSILTGANNSPGSFSNLGKQYQLQNNLRNITTNVSPQLISKRASSSFAHRNENSIVYLNQVDSHVNKSTEDICPFTLNCETEEDKFNSLKDISSNLAENSIVNVQIIQTPLKNKINKMMMSINSKELPELKITPDVIKKNIRQKLEIKNSAEQNNWKQQMASVHENDFKQEYDGIKKYIKSNSEVYKMRKMNIAKLEICKQQNIDVQGNQFKNLGIIEDVELPKYVINKLKNQTNIFNQLQRLSSPSRVNSFSTHSQLPISSTAYDKKRSIINNNISTIKSNNLSHDKTYDSDSQRINKMLHYPLKNLENDKLKQMINQIRYIDSQQYKVQTQKQFNNSLPFNFANKSFIKLGNSREDPIQKQVNVNRSLSPISSVKNKNQSILMQKIVLNPNKSQEQRKKSNSQYTISWEQSPYTLSPPLHPNYLINL